MEKRMGWGLSQLPESLGVTLAGAGVLLGTPVWGRGLPPGKEVLLPPQAKPGRGSSGSSQIGSPKESLRDSN